ncbi:MAG: hypothetical protein MUF25_02465 [Pirellulaceae bacterium]|jgi:hypothetical protein|nr:hypothetical protein [Pirellulaceae bacterium]
MTKFFSRQLLYRLRNEIPVATLVPQLDWPHKHRERRFCFLFPRCGEFLTAVNPRTNLARCFACETNFNPIDLVMVIHRCDFVAAVHFLEATLPASNAG